MRRAVYLSSKNIWQARQRGSGAGTAAGGSQTAEITVSDITIARMFGSEPTTVFSGQSLFTCTSYSGSAVQENCILKVNSWPGALSGKTVTAVTLMLYHSVTGYASATSTLSIWKVLRTVVMGQVTATVYSTGNAWGSLMGVGAADIDISGAALTTVAMPAGENQAGSLICPSSAALVALVQAQKDGAANNGYLLNPSYFADYHTFDGPTGANPPAMIVTYTP